MARRTIFTVVPVCIIVFWTGLFAVLPWYIPAGGALLLFTLFVLIISGEPRMDIPQPSGEEMERDGGDLWDYPPRCLEEPDPYQTRRAA